MTPVAAIVPDTARETLWSSYEVLRRAALAGADADRLGRGVGFTLFIRSGMARWMDACVELLARPAATPPPPRHVEEQPRFDPDLHLEVAMVLAQMALFAHAQGATTC